MSEDINTNMNRWIENPLYRLIIRKYNINPRLIKMVVHKTNPHRETWNVIKNKLHEAVIYSCNGQKEKITEPVEYVKDMITASFYK